MEERQSVSVQDARQRGRAPLTADEAIVASNQANVARLEKLQSYEKVYAPFDGIITARNTDIGALINAGAGAPNTELFRIRRSKRCAFMLPCRKTMSHQSISARPPQ